MSQRTVSQRDPNFPCMLSDNHLLQLKRMEKLPNFPPISKNLCLLGTLWRKLGFQITLEKEHIQAKNCNVDEQQRNTTDQVWLCGSRSFVQCQLMLLALRLMSYSFIQIWPLSARSFRVNPHRRFLHYVQLLGLPGSRLALIQSP